MMFRDLFLGIRDACKTQNKTLLQQNNTLLQSAKATQDELNKVKNDLDTAKKQLAYLQHEEGNFKVQIQSLKASEKALGAMKLETDNIKLQLATLPAVEKAKKEADQEIVKVMAEVDKRKSQIAALESSLTDSNKTADTLAQDCAKLKGQITVRPFGSAVFL